MKLPAQDADTPKWGLHSRFRSFEKWVINETDKQRKDGIYRPRLRFIRRGKAGFLQIEFSVPKLLYGNNVSEVSEKDFDLVIETLRKRLRDFNIGIYSNTLANAEVSSFHPSKNIVLRDGYTASSVITELSKINLTKKMDMPKIEFRNEGQAMQCYAISHSLVIYDKIPDLNRQRGRAIDKDQTTGQQSLFECLNIHTAYREILRIEARLSKKVKLNAVMRQVNEVPNPTFRDIFKKNVCQKIVQLYWNKMMKGENQFLFDMSRGPQTLLKKILLSYPYMKPKQAVYMAGLYTLGHDEGGIRQLRSIIEPVAQRRGWYRIADDFKALSALQGLTMHDWVRQVDNQIGRFEPLKLPT